MVSVHEGVAITELGKLALVYHFENLNILLKIPKIPFVKSLSCEFDHKSRELGSYLEYNLRAVEHDYHTFLTSRKALLKEYLPKKVVRRSLWSSIANLAYTTLLGGLSEIQILKIKQHLKTTNDEIDRLKTTLSDLHNDRVLFEQHTVALVQKFNYLIQREINSQNCLSEMMTYILNTKINVLSYRNTLDAVLWPDITGVSSVPLTPSILGPHVLSRIVQTHETFKDMIFYDNPVYLYTISQLTLVEVDNQLCLVKFVLTFPRIRGDRILPLAKVSQLGLSLGENLCKRFLLPLNVFEDQGLLRDIYLRDCTHHGSLHVCKNTKFPFFRSCIQSSSFDCNSTVSVCATPFEMIQLREGVLFRDNEDRHFVRNLDNRIDIPYTTSSRIGLILWNSSFEFQLHDVSINSPNLESEPFMGKNFSTPISFNHSEITVQPAISALMDKYKSTIQEELRHEYGQEFSKIQKAKSHHLLLIIFTASITTLWLFGITILVVVFYRRYRHKIVNAFKSEIFGPQPSVPDRRLST